ncbi:ATP-binding cassette domain-containing protein [Kineococcus auxinigenes]|uniref:ATP-binding cassette domain-containing protein n=1 Tax=unclassified Kineococcus TaxID=2621656 RepID=UPI003D7D0E44
MLTSSQAPPQRAVPDRARPGAGRDARSLTASRLAGPRVAVAGALAVLAAVGETLGTVVTGRLAEDPRPALVAALAVLLVGAGVLDTAGRTVFATRVGRAEGRLRADLLEAALAQPLPVLAEQAVGEVLDRVDDDPRQLARLLRETGWHLARALLRSSLAWVVAGLTWWPAWIAFPLVAAAALLVARPLTAEVARRKLAEEAAWTDHAAELEEAVAARDDVRSSLGRPYVLRRYARGSAVVLRAVLATNRVASSVGLRTALVLSLLLVSLVLGGVALVLRGDLGVADLVTTWLLMAGFVGGLTQVSDRLPEVQAGLGALQRIRALLTAPAEPAGGLELPAGPLALRVRALDFAYPGGGFALRGVDLEVPAGTTCALVGRSGSGKSTLASLFSRAVEPPAGAVLVGGRDVREVDLHALRGAVGVVTQRTELLAATLAENITLTTAVPRAVVEEAVDALGLREWVRALPDGLDTPLGPGGTVLSAGEEQLVAFARLLVRDVRVVVLDEATARMDPVTEHRVTAAAERLLAGRTGLLIAHRLSTTRRADAVAVLDGGRLVQHGPRARLAAAPGPFADLLAAAGTVDPLVDPDPDPDPDPEQEPVAGPGPGPAVPAARRPRPAVPEPSPRLARTVLRAITLHRRWGLVGAVLFLAMSLLGAHGAVTGALWGHVVAGASERAGTGSAAGVWPAALAVCVALLAGPFALCGALRVYFSWWNAVALRARCAVLAGQTRQHRLPRVPPGEVTARCLDSDRFVLYVDRWVDVVLGCVVVVVTSLLAGTAGAGAVVAAVMACSALVSVAGAGVAGRSAAGAGDARARFGRSLGSAVDAARTVKLAAAAPAVLAHLHRVDDARVRASVREFRVRAVLEGVPVVLVQLGLVATWWLHLRGTWGLATALLVSTAVAGSSYYGQVAGAVVTEAPVAREWLRAVAALAGRADVLEPPAGVDLVAGTAPVPDPAPRRPLRELELRGFSAVHDDGTVGVADVDLRVRAGELVLLTGRVGSGKSSLLAALAGLADHEGSLRWNGAQVQDPQVFLRPGRVSYVAQLPRVLSGSFAGNATLDHAAALPRLGPALADARLEQDVAAAGGPDALVGHRGVRLSGGQVQRLALARALAAGADLLVADDVSSALDARTEVELWGALRRRGTTVLGSSSKRSALAAADRVVVLVDGRVAASGPWCELERDWGHLAG